MATNSLSRSRSCRRSADSKSREAGRKRRADDARRRVPIDTHAGRGAEVCDLLADAAGADNTYGLIPNDYGIVSLMIEAAALFFCDSSSEGRARSEESSPAHTRPWDADWSARARWSPRYPSPKDRYRENCSRRREARAPISSAARALVNLSMAASRLARPRPTRAPDCAPRGSIAGDFLAPI